MSVFDLIAPVYGLFFNYQVRYFKKIQERASQEIDLEEYESVLDIGCGTGALPKTLHDRGLRVTGVDPSPGMIGQARKKLRGTSIELREIRAGEDLPFDDKSFDLVITSYVAHGLQPKERIDLYREMRRIARKAVIIHDYNDKRALLTTIVEWLERGDYFNFIRVAKEEMEGVFPRIKEINVDTRASWYICYCDEGEEGLEKKERESIDE